MSLSDAPASSLGAPQQPVPPRGARAPEQRPELGLNAAGLRGRSSAELWGCKGFPERFLPLLNRSSCFLPSFKSGCAGFLLMTGALEWISGLGGRDLGRHAASKATNAMRGSTGSAVTLKSLRKTTTYMWRLHTLEYLSILKGPAHFKGGISKSRCKATGPLI